MAVELYDRAARPGPRSGTLSEPRPLVRKDKAPPEEAETCSEIRQGLGRFGIPLALPRWTIIPERLDVEI